jgi:hypothetical protein
MPKTATDYSKNVIYKIQHNDDDSLLYVGHTCNFTKRKYKHKSDCKLSQKPLYNMVRDNGGWECFTMIVIQEYPCETKMEACIEEDRVMREMKATMNTLRAYTTPEEKKKQQKEYMKENREPIREYKKAYQQANKESIREYKKDYHQANKELLSEKAKEPIECECGCIIRKSDLAKHKRSKKHLESINC